MQWARHSLELGYSIVIDACNMTPKRRNVWNGRGLGYEVEVKYVMFEARPDECKRRALNINKMSLLSVIDRMYDAQDYSDINEADILETVGGDCG